MSLSSVLTSCILSKRIIIILISSISSSSTALHSASQINCAVNSVYSVEQMPPSVCPPLSLQPFSPLFFLCNILPSFASSASSCSSPSMCSGNYCVYHRAQIAWASVLLCSPLIRPCRGSSRLFGGRNRILSRRRVFSHESVCLCWGEDDHMTRAAGHTAHSLDFSRTFTLASALRFSQLRLHSRV